MNYTQMTRVGHLALSLSIFVALSICYDAAAADSWQVRANFLAIDPRAGGSDEQVIEDAEIFTFIDHDNRFGFSAERRLSGRLGLELGLFQASPDLAVSVFDHGSGEALGDVDSLDLFSVTVGLNVHLTPNRRADVYFGPLVAWVSAGDLNLGNSGDTQHFKIGDEVVPGAVVGVDVRIKESKWGFNASIRYLDYSFMPTAEDGAGVEVQFDPVIIGLGASYKF